MKKFQLKPLILMSLFVFVSSCSTFKKKSPDGINALTNYDQAKMAKVEQASVNSGVRVIWIHPPLKKK